MTERDLKRRVGRTLALVERVIGRAGLQHPGISPELVGLLNPLVRGLARLVGTGDLRRFRGKPGRVSQDRVYNLKRARKYVLELVSAEGNEDRAQAVQAGAWEALAALDSLALLLEQAALPRRLDAPAEDPQQTLEAAHA